MKEASKIAAALLVFAGLLAGCAQFRDRPWSVEEFRSDLEARSLDDPGLRAFLAKNGFVADSPRAAWDSTALSTVAFFFHPDLDVARAQLAGGKASRITAGERPNPTVSHVHVDPTRLGDVAMLRNLPLRTPGGVLIKLSQVADLSEIPGQIELRREDLRQNVGVTARLEGRDLGSAMSEIREKLAKDKSLPAGSVEFGGLFQQQQESFHNLLIVLATAILLVFTVLLIEFRSYHEPVAIVFGSVLALLGTVLALWLTGTTLNIVSFLGAIIGVGIVAKNGILMLDYVDHLLAEGVHLDEALVRSGHRRLRPVLMTSLAAGLGMLPLAYGIGSGADMLKPLAIGVTGALCISVVLSLVATPTLYSLISKWWPKDHK